MVYSDFVFLALIPFVLGLFYFFTNVRAQNTVLLIQGAIFIGYAGLPHLLIVLLVITIGLAYFTANQQRDLGTAGITCFVTTLLLMLGYFKYRDLIGEVTGLHIPAVFDFAWIIPLGISFYTFEAIGAIIDARAQKLTVRAFPWASFIMFFPHLIAGPIVRYRTLAPQFDYAKQFTTRNLLIGGQLFVLGFAKKTLIADPVGVLIAPVWADPANASSGALLLALIGFYVQVYADFSGYTDMGRGVARALGFRLPINFRAPYLAASPTEFFQRWHISLSNWIRVFFYDRLAFAVSRRLLHSRAMMNLGIFCCVIIVMTGFGLWHGGALRFVLFGFLLGCLIAGWGAVTRGRQPKTLRGRVGSALLMQLSFLLLLIPFRAPDLSAAAAYLLGLFAMPSGNVDPSLLWCLAALVAVLAIQTVDYWATERRTARFLIRWRGRLAGGAVTALLFIAIFATKIYLEGVMKALNPIATKFIYFSF